METRPRSEEAAIVVPVRNSVTRHVALIALGVTTTVASAGVGFLRAFAMDGRPQGMPLSEMPEMFVAGAGILLVLAGTLLRGNISTRSRPDAAASPRRRGLVAAVVTAALTIDISKTSTLGFVIPGMRAEYDLGPTTASVLAVAGLSGTATGALLFSRLAGRIGLRGSYLIATLGFTATSMCAMMPTFTGNAVMCFLMGVTVGGLAPLLITTLTDLFPGTRRGAVVTGLSMVATAIGYLIASGSALWLEPTYGWRVLWLIGAPTGLLLVLVTALVPDRNTASRAALEDTRRQLARNTFTTRLQWLYAATVGLLTFGLTAWLPTLARAGDLDSSEANTLLTAVAVVMVPCSLLIAIGYRRLGPIPLAVLMAFGTAALLLTLTTFGLAAVMPWLSAAALAAALFAVNTMAAVFLPIASDLADASTRSRTTGTVSFFNRLGGLTGPLLLSLVVSSVADMLTAVAVLALLCGAIAWYTGRRHRTITSTTRPDRSTPASPADTLATMHPSSQGDGVHSA